MKKIFWILFLAAALLFSACGAAATATPLPARTEAPAAPSTGFSSPDAVIASAEVVPLRDASMAFEISAPVKEILVKEGDVVKAGQPVISLYTPDLEISINEAELSVKSAELQLQRANYPYKKKYNEGHITYVMSNGEMRQEMQARLEGAQASLDEAKYTLSQGTLVAPFDGTIVNLAIDQWQVTQPGSVALIIADTLHMQIKTTDLSERDISKVNVGQSVNVFVEPLNAHLTGKVIRISPISKIVGGDAVYPVTIELDKQIDGLLWGMSTEVEIITK